MSGKGAKADARVARAEAAVWLARLRSEERSAQDERGFRAWLAESHQNREAFELTNAIFDIAGAADRSALISRKASSVTRRHFLQSSAGLAAASVAGIALYLRSGSTYATAVGEQRKVALEDGTNVHLDTDTEIRVSMNEDYRRVQLRRGRAHFDVAEDPSRPFEVIAGAHSLKASGSHFDVSRDGALVSVLLENGPVSIGPEAAGAGVVGPRTVLPGQRLVFADDKIVREDHPVMARAIAWRDGRLAFFEEPLSEAVAEMNRYTKRPIVILDPQIGQLQISGNYSVNDAEAFAASLAMLLPVVVEREEDRVVLRAIQASQSSTG